MLVLCITYASIVMFMFTTKWCDCIIRRSYTLEKYVQLYKFNYLFGHLLRPDRIKAITIIICYRLPIYRCHIWYDSACTRHEYYNEKLCSDFHSRATPHTTPYVRAMGCLLWVIHRKLGAVSIRKTVLPGMAIPMLKIRRPNGRLIFNMEIAIRR